MANQEDSIQLKKFEDEAILLIQKGNILGAIEELEKAIVIEKRWYHLYVKASWLYISPEKNIDEISSLIQEGFLRFPDQRFWFLYIRADIRRYEVVRLAATSQQKMEVSISQLLEAQKDINLAINEIRESPQIIQATINNPPDLFSTLFYAKDRFEVLRRVNDLRLETIYIHQTISMMKYVIDAEIRINSRIDKQEVNMQSEKMRTIEILGFFTRL